MTEQILETYYELFWQLLLLVWIITLKSSYLSDIIVFSSFVQYAALLPADLFMFAIGHML